MINLPAYLHLFETAEALDQALPATGYPKLRSLLLNSAENFIDSNRIWKFNDLKSLSFVIQLKFGLKLYFVTRILAHLQVLI